MAGLAVGFICSVLFHTIVKEAKLTKDFQEEVQDENGISKAVRVESQKTVKEHLYSLQLYQVAAVYMATRLFANLSQVQYRTYWILM